MSTEVMQELSIKEWRSMLERFNATKNLQTETGKRTSYAMLKSDATLSHILTHRQKDSLIGRCDWELQVLDNPDLRKEWKEPNVHKPAAKPPTK